MQKAQSGSDGILMNNEGKDKVLQNVCLSHVNEVEIAKPLLDKTATLWTRRRPSAESCAVRFELFDISNTNKTALILAIAAHVYQTLLPRRLLTTLDQVDGHNFKFSLTPQPLELLEGFFHNLRRAMIQNAWSPCP
jgi:hypothetical protein